MEGAGELADDTAARALRLPSDARPRTRERHLCGTGFEQADKPYRSAAGWGCWAQGIDVTSMLGRRVEAQLEWPIPDRRFRRPCVEAWIYRIARSETRPLRDRMDGDRNVGPPFGRRGWKRLPREEC